MKKIIILVIAACVMCGGIFSVSASSASIFHVVGEIKVRNFISNYYDALSKKNVRYVVDHNANYQDALAGIHRKNPKKNWDKLGKQFFLDSKKLAEKNSITFWADWPRLLDGTRIFVDEVRRINREEASEMGIENRDEVYRVFVRFHFTKRSSSRFDQKNAVLLKEFVLQVFVYYDYGKMLFDTNRGGDVVEYRVWSNDV